MTTSRLIAEWTEGTAGRIPGHETFPAISEILPGLWSGGCLDGLYLPDEFGFVLSVFPWGKYQLGPDTDRLQVSLYDGPEVPPITLLNSLAVIVNWQHQMEEKTVLVHCQAGLNRSSLVVVGALILRGMTPDEAIALVREKRSPYCLCNPEFERYLRGLA